MRRRYGSYLHNLLVWPFTWSLFNPLIFAFTNSRLSRWLMKPYIFFGGVNMAEAEKPLATYQTIGELFCRRLQAGARPIDPSPEVISSPVDATVIAWGKIRDTLTLQVKGERYSVASLLGSAKLANCFLGGDYAVLYMKAGAYHHVHAPISGYLVGAYQIPGRHFPLYHLSRQSIPGLYHRNTRQINLLTNYQQPPLALVQVASTFVSSIYSNYPLAKKYTHPSYFTKGEEMGYFTFGSTVILLFPPGVATIELGDDTHDDPLLKMGEKLAIYYRGR
ncbi:MAG: archaetidylserine decarboxylase [Symbiobacteriaceae bacterium]|nr:archaetidylserine decarboxylase [Symbiobacteriaceae bacterium]